MGRVLDALASHCGGLGPATHLVDVGAGLGRPLLHALALGAGAGSGVEVDAVKVEKATAFAAQTARALAGRGGEAWLERSDEEAVERGEGGGGAPPPPASSLASAPPAAPLAALPDIQCAPIEAMPSLDPATHVFSFWEGIPPAARAAFGRLVAASATIRGVAVVQRAARGRGPAAMMADAGFGPLRLRAAFPVAMSGSGRSFQAYIFAREVPSRAGPAAVPHCTAPLPRAVVSAAAALPAPPAGGGAAAGRAPSASGAPAPPTPSDTARSARRDRRRAGLPAGEAGAAPAPAPPAGRPPRPITAFGRVVRSAAAGGGPPPAGPVARPGQVTPHHPGEDAFAGAAARAAAPASPAATGRGGGGGAARRGPLAPASPGVAKKGAASPVAKKAGTIAAAAARKVGRPPLAPRGLGGALQAAVGGK